MALGNLGVFQEKVDSTAISTAGASVDGGKAVGTYYLTAAPTAADLQEAITLLLGGTTFAASPSGRVQRQNPAANPTFPYWYASNISNIQGVGKFTLTQAQNTLEVPPLPQFALYEEYGFTVEFTPRTYPVVPDNQIAKRQGTWFNRDGFLQNFFYVQEWDRYCDWELTPQNDSLTCQQGQMEFLATSGANEKQFVGCPRIFLPNSLLTVKWHQIPYRYISSPNSFIAGNGVRQWRGCVNQNEWTLSPLVFPAGSLLYLNYKAVKYSPPVQRLVQNWFGDGGVFSTEKLCDVEFTFLHTSRKVKPGDLPGARANGNFVMGGHNLLPWLSDREFHYAETRPLTVPVVPRTPSFYSFPLELLFQDPDGLQPGIISDY